MKSLFEIIKGWFKPAKVEKCPDLIFSSPDKEGVVTVTTPSGDSIKMQTISQEKLDRFHLIGEGYSTKEIDVIMKKRKREKQLKKLLENEKDRPQSNRKPP